MATYAELYNLRSDTALRNKVRVAVAKKAQALVDLATPTQGQLAWASQALTNPDAVADQIFNYVLVVNSAATAAQIQAATDAAIQTNVNAAVDKLVTIGAS